MSADGSEELLVTIQPLAATAAAAEGEYRPWLGPLVLFGCPVLLAIMVFIALIVR